VESSTSVASAWNAYAYSTGIFKVMYYWDGRLQMLTSTCTCFCIKCLDGWVSKCDILNPNYNIFCIIIKIILIHVPCILLFIITNKGTLIYFYITTVSLCNLYSYMFQHFHVNIRWFTINALLSNTCSSNCSCWKYSL